MTEITEQFHEERAKRITGTTAQSLAGSPWNTPYQEWLEKTGRKQRDNIDDQEHIWWGRELEEKVAKRYCEKTGRKVRRHGFVTHKDYPFIGGHIDRLILNDGRGPGVLEVKTTGWGDVECESDLPEYYWAQFQHYLMVTGYTWGSFAYLINGNKFRTFDVGHDPDYQHELLRAELAFWEQVQTDTAPPVTGGDLSFISAMHPVDDGSTVEVDDPEFREIVLEFTKAKAEKKDATEREKTYGAVIRARFGGATQVIVPGYGAMTWKAAAPSTRTFIDEEAMQADGVYEKYLRTESVPGSRRLLLKPAKV